MRIGVDLMGSDSSPVVVFEAVLAVAHEARFPLCLVVIATRSLVGELRGAYRDALNSLGKGRIEFHTVRDAIEMGDAPMVSVSRKRGASLLVGIRLLRKGSIDGLVSAGNTGALVAAATLHLPKLPGMKRPALLALLPSLSSPLALLDVGGSVSCKTPYLVQLASLGAAFYHCCYEVERPRVALLNIGVEPIKGTSAVREAYKILMEGSAERTDFQFVGNVEGQRLFHGGIHVVVTDGFTGNVVLKTCEGVSAFLFEQISKNLPHQTSGDVIHALEKLKGCFSQAEHPGAVLCGIERVVVKCHGSASVQAICSSIRGAIALVEQQMIPKVKARLEQLYGIGYRILL